MKIWSPRRERALFVHIPKTAGMTLRAALGSQYALEDRAPAVDWAGLRSLPRPLDQYKLYAGHFRYFLRRLLPEDTKVFTFLRDPVDRTISHLRHLAHDPNFHELHELAKGRDLRAIAQDPRVMSYCSNVMVGYLSRSVCSAEQLRRFPPEDACATTPETIDDALAALDEMDFVGFVDDFDDDFARLSELLGLHPPATLPVINSAEARQAGADTDTELREIVREANRLDCAFYAEARRLCGARPPVSPRADRIADLLRRQVYTPIEEPTLFPMDGPLPGYGFWPTDAGNDGRQFRWTGPEREMGFELPICAGREKELILEAYVPRDVGHVTARVLGVDVALDWPDKYPTAVTLSISIPAQSEDRNVVTVILSVETVMKASARDDRSVGFILGGANISQTA